MMLALMFLYSGRGYAQGDVIFFSESPNNQYYDYSFGFDTGNCFLETTGPTGDKFPVDSNHPYQGTHSLRLHWRSSSIGDWGIAVASVDWVAYDLTQYDSITYFINASQAIAPVDLPDMALEDINNHKSSRVWIGNYFSGVDNDSITWQKVSIPISAFHPGPENADFTHIKTIYHYKRTADNVDHLVWVDEIRAVQAMGGGGTLPNPPQGVAAQGYDSRIDLRWRFNPDPNIFGYHVYRSALPGGNFTRLTSSPHQVHLYSDFFGQNNQTYYYYITTVNYALEESSPSDTVSATSAAMTDDELLTSVQEAAFRYFYDYGHPVSGLARERLGSGDVCTSGGTGFGVMSLIVGSERGFISRDSAAARTLKIIRFLQDTASRYHGAWSHWINGATGETIPFSQFDDGGDLVETAYLIQGLLTARQYYQQTNPVETEIRDRIDQLWQEVEWDWYRRYPNGNVLYWHWSPNFGWLINLPIRGYNEAHIVYLLAVASPTHGIPPLLYHQGWARSGAYPYLNGNDFYGYHQWVGVDYGGPLFFTHYSYMGFDPRDKADYYANYFENSKNISLINRTYCINNPQNHTGYDSLSWGLTASDDPWGYSAHAPFSNDNGTITPTAALSAMPYLPEESMATLNYFYHTLGASLWGEFGFKDAFNPDQNWYAASYIAIDQGPIVVMIENYRTQLCWNLFMANPEIQPMLTALGFTPTRIKDTGGLAPNQFALFQNYPNPFNPETAISYRISIVSSVDLSIYTVLGQKVRTLVKEHKAAGRYTVQWDGRDDRGGAVASGVYFYRLGVTPLPGKSSNTPGHGRKQYVFTRKMLLVR